MVRCHKVGLGCSTSLPCCCCILAACSIAASCCSAAASRSARPILVLEVLQDQETLEMNMSGNGVNAYSEKRCTRFQKSKIFLWVAKVLPSFLRYSNLEDAGPSTARHFHQTFPPSVPIKRNQSQTKCELSSAFNYPPRRRREREHRKPAEWSSDKTTEIAKKIEGRNVGGTQTCATPIKMSKYLGAKSGNFFHVRCFF